MQTMLSHAFWVLLRRKESKRPVRNETPKVSQLALNFKQSQREFVYQHRLHQVYWYVCRKFCWLRYFVTLVKLWTHVGQPWNYATTKQVQCLVVKISLKRFPPIPQIVLKRVVMD